MPVSGLPRPYPKRADGAEVCVAAKRWFDGWAQSGQADSFTSWHWDWLEMTTLLIDAFYGSPSAAAMAQIRATEAILEEAGG
jgi:hypothetical protein